MKYVIILEMEDGYMDCVAICDTIVEAYGTAFSTLVDGFDSDSHYVTLPVDREGENGIIMELKDKATDKSLQWVTVLFYT